MRCLVLLVGLAACGRLGFDATTDAGMGDAEVDAAPGIGPWAQVFANANHTCAVQDSGEAWCWGSHMTQQLGTGGLGMWTKSPAQLAGTWRTLALGRDSGCGIQVDGSLWCWGRDNFAQVPDGILTTDAAVPVRIGTDVDWVGVGVAFRHGCARKADNTLWCWGDNSYKQYDPLVATSSTPQLTRSNVRAFSVGYLHSHVVDLDGTLHVIGLVQQGEGGTGVYSIMHTTYTQVGVDTTWRDVTTGLTRTCAIKADGTMWCCGEGTYGGIGNGANGSPASLTKVLTGSNWSAGPTTQGFQHTCGMRADGTAWCWGVTTRGQVGAQTDNLDEPVSLGEVRSVATGDHHTCLVTTGGVIRCSGVNVSAQIRDPASTSLVPVAAGGSWAKLDAHAESTCAIDAAGALWCWGDNNTGQLGTGDRRWRQVPTQIAGSAWSDVSVGVSFSVGIQNNGLYWWGEDTANGGAQLTPAQLLTGFTDFVKVATGREHACALRGNGDLYCWGFNSSGQLGDGTNTNRPAPVLVGTGFSEIAAGATHTCAVQGPDTRCWGANLSGQIGNNTASNVSVPTTITCGGCAGRTVRTLALGDQFSCANMTDDSIYCWGSNANGQFGNGTSVSSLVGVSAGGGGAIWRTMATGDLHTCAIYVLGEVHCWGHGDEGQIGNGQTPSSQLATTLVDNSTDWASVATGTHVSCALRTNGARYCWGTNGGGVYGNGLGWIEDFVTISPEQ